MARLGYLFLVAVLGFTILGPSMASAGEWQGLKQHVARHGDRPTKHAPIRYNDDRRHGHQQPQHWGVHNQPQHWRNRHYVRRPPARRFFFVPPPVVRHHSWDHRDYRPYRRSSSDLGTVDFNINYHLFF